MTLPCHMKHMRFMAQLKQIVKRARVLDIWGFGGYLHAGGCKMFLNITESYILYTFAMYLSTSKLCWITTGFNMQRHHNDVIKWKHFQRYWPFVRGIHRSSVNSPHKGQWRGALIFSLISAWTTVEQTMEMLVILDTIALIITWM